MFQIKHQAVGWQVAGWIKWIYLVSKLSRKLPNFIALFLISNHLTDSNSHNAYNTNFFHSPIPILRNMKVVRRGVETEAIRLRVNVYCVRQEMNLFGLMQEWMVNRDVWRDLIRGKH